MYSTMDQPAHPVKAVPRSEWHDAFAAFARLAPEQAACVEVPSTSMVYRIGDMFFALTRGHGDSMHVGSVFRMGARGCAADIVAYLRTTPGVGVICLTAFCAVADKVWAPLGFQRVQEYPFDWRQAPLLWRSAYGTPSVHSMEMKL